MFDIWVQMNNKVWPLIIAAPLGQWIIFMQLMHEGQLPEHRMCWTTLRSSSLQFLTSDVKADEAVLICAVSIFGFQDSYHLTEGIALLYCTPVQLPLKPRRVVVNVWHSDGYHGGGGERLWLPQIRGHHFKAVAGAGLVVHLTHCGDPACFTVNTKDRTRGNGATEGASVFRQVQVVREERSEAVGYLQFQKDTWSSF